MTPRRTSADADADAKFELHQYPVGIIDHALALVGPAKASLRSLSDLTNPGAAASAGSTGPAADWTSFTLTRGSLSAGASAGGADRATTPQAPQLSYAQKGGKWLALPKGGNDWTVSWYDGKFPPFLVRPRTGKGVPVADKLAGNGVVMYTTMPVNITYEAVADA